MNLNQDQYYQELVDREEVGFIKLKVRMLHLVNSLVMDTFILQFWGLYLKINQKLYEIYVYFLPQIINQVFKHPNL